MGDFETFAIPSFALRTGLTLDAGAFLAYKTYGTLVRLALVITLDA